MTVKELEEFFVICERGSLAKASRELYMSPQGLSRVVKNLENELKCTLLRRTAAGIELTESGECLKAYAGETLRSYRNLCRELEQIQRNADGAVDLLAAYDVIRYLTPECILDFQRLYPNVAFSFEEWPDRIVEQRLIEKKGNIALSVGPFQGSCYDVKPLVKRRLGLLAYRDHPLSERNMVSVLDLKGQPLYLENGSFKLNELFQSCCWSKGFEPDIIFETNGFDLCYKMCREKKGLSVTVDFVHEDMKSEDVVMIPFEEPELVWEIGILTEKGSVMEPAVQQFCRFLENKAASTEC